MLDTSGGRSVLQVLQEHLSEVLIPALDQGQQWGPLLPQQVESFMATLRGYVRFLQSEYGMDGMDIQAP